MVNTDVRGVVKSIFIHDFTKTIVNFGVNLLWFCLNICIILTGGVEVVFGNSRLCYKDKHISVSLYLQNNSSSDSVINTLLLTLLILVCKKYTLGIY